MATLSPNGIYREFDNNGNPLSGGLLYTYEAGTTTPKQTFNSQDETSANTNPIVLDSAGRAQVWLDSGAYKFIQKDADDVTLWETDDITGSGSNVFGAQVVDISANKTVTTVEANYIFVATAALTVTLPSASEAEEGFVVSVRNSTASSDVTIDPDGSELINGVSTLTLQSGDFAIIVSNGTSWDTLDTTAGVKLQNDNTFTGDTVFTGTLQQTKADATTYDPTATDAQADVGSSLVLYNPTNSNASISQLVLGLRNPDFFVRLVATGGTTPDFAIVSDVTEIARFTSDSRLGIGTNDPQESLDVVGNAQASGTITATNINNTSYASTAAKTTITANIPLDNTIPQNTEGAQVLTASITPSSTSAKIRVTVVHSSSSGGVGGSCATALFKDSGVNAIAVEAVTPTGNQSFFQTVLQYEDSPATTSEVTYDVRVGLGSGSMTFNGTTTDYYGGTKIASIKLEEV